MVNKKLNFAADPLISIIIPSYNREDIIAESIESVRNQSYPNWELIIVDDHSTDNSPELVRNFAKAEERIRFFRRTSERKGASVARNEGIEKARGEWIIFLDSDDLLAPHCLKNRVAQISQQEDLDLLVFQSKEFVEKPNDCNTFINKLEESTNHLERFLTFDIPWITTAPIWRKTSLIEIGAWKEELPSWQDWELHIRALILGLKYKTFAQSDNYWRRPIEGSIGMESRAEHHLQSHEALVSGLYKLLLANNKATSRMNAHFIRLYFFLAKEWVKKGKIERALKCWGIPYNNGWISKAEHEKGKLYIGKYEFFRLEKMPEFGVFNKILNRLFTFILPNELAIPSSKTFHKYKGDQ